MMGRVIATLRDRLAAGEPLIGTFSMLGSGAVCELAGRSGLEFVFIDCEHGEISPYGTEIVGLVRACAAGGAVPLVRLPEPERGAAQRVLDAGAAGILIPQVGTPERARAAVAITRRPPAGLRGSAGVVRGGGYGTTPGALAAAEPLAAIMLESPAAVERAEELLATEGLDAVMFGPYDYAMAAGEPDPGAPGPGVAAGARARVRGGRGARPRDRRPRVGHHPGARADRGGAQLVAVGADVAILGTAFAGLRETALGG